MDEDSNADGLPINWEAAAGKVALAAAGGAKEGIRGTVADVWGGLIGDRVQEWRKRNLVGSLEKTASKLESRGISLEQTKQLPDWAVYSIFDGVSKVDTPELSDLWAGFLAAKLASDPDEALDRKFATILQQLSESDATLLKYINWASVTIRASENEMQQRASDLSGHEKSTDADPKLMSFAEHRHQIIYRLREALETEYVKLGLDQKLIADLARDNLLSLALIEPIKSAKKRRRSNAGFRNHYRGILGVEGQLSEFSRHISERFHNFEDWAGEELTGPKRSVANFPNALTLEINFQLSAFGRAFFERLDLFQND